MDNIYTTKERQSKREDFYRENRQELKTQGGNATLDSSGVLVIPTGPPTHYLDRSSLFERDGKLYNPDFVKIAEAYGVKAKKIRSSGEIKKTVQEAVKTNEPYLIEVVTDRNSPTYFCPGVTRGYPIRWDKLAYLKQ